MRFAIASVPLTSQDDAGVIALAIRDPGIVRGLTFVMQRRAIVTVNDPPVQEYPVAFVESSPEGELRDRKFALLPSDRMVNPPNGVALKWLATGISPGGTVAHLFEIEEVS